MAPSPILSTLCLPDVITFDQIFHTFPYKQSKGGGGNSLGTRLDHFFFFYHSHDYSSSPPDPTQWTEDQVYRWAEWTVQEFGLTSVNLSALRGISGHQLCSFTSQQFFQLDINTTDALYLQEFLDIIKAGKQVSPKALTKI